MQIGTLVAKTGKTVLQSDVTKQLFTMIVAGFAGSFAGKAWDKVVTPTPEAPVSTES